MYVGVGNLCDYRKPNGERIHGLAHFLEHMLFLGTEKYPKESHYHEFISTHGGQKNAATSEDYTYYYFDVKNDAFEEALDIFS
jgi:insulysin